MGDHPIEVVYAGDYIKRVTRATPFSAGIDIFSPYSFILKAGQRHTVNLGLKFGLPMGTFGLLAARSSLAMNFGIQVLGGVREL